MMGMSLLRTLPIIWRFLEHFSLHHTRCDNEVSGLEQQNCHLSVVMPLANRWQESESNQSLTDHESQLSELCFLATEQQTNTKFCFNLGKTPTETYEMLRTLCGDETLSRGSEFGWFKRFINGRENIQDGPRIGRPSTTRNGDTVARVVKLRHEIAEGLSVWYDSPYPPWRCTE